MLLFYYNFEKKIKHLYIFLNFLLFYLEYEFFFEMYCFFFFVILLLLISNL